MNETWESFLEKLRKSDWHMGLSGWKAGADIDWLLKTANFVKIIEREDHGNDKHSGRNGRNPSGGEITQNSGTKPISIFDQLAAKAVQRGRQLDGFGTKSNIPSGGKEWAIDENRPA